MAIPAYNEEASIESVVNAVRHEAPEFDLLVTFDGDGQHRATDLKRLCRAFVEGDYDLLIGSRFLRQRQYESTELGRRLGMWLFSGLVALLSGQRIYDTSSGFRVFHRRAFDLLTEHPFVDFHAEAIVLLLRRGYKVGEESIVASERRAGASMSGALSALKYSLKTSLLVLLGYFGSGITDHKR